MAGAGEVLEKARTLFDGMGERTQKLAQSAGEAEQNYQRLIEKIHEAASAVERLRSGAVEAQGELRAVWRHLLWLVLFVSFIGGMSAAVGIHFLSR
jgi:hypothetical protein